MVVTKRYRASHVTECLFAVNEGRYTFVYFNLNLEFLHEVYFGMSFATRREAQDAMEEFIQHMNLDFSKPEDANAAL